MIWSCLCQSYRSCSLISLYMFVYVCHKIFEWFTSFFLYIPCLNWNVHPWNCKAPPIYTIPRTSLHFGNDARSVQRKGMENVTTIQELIPRRLKKSRSRWVHEFQFPNTGRSGSKANHFTSSWSVVSLPVAESLPSSTTAFPNLGSRLQVGSLSVCPGVAKTSKYQTWSILNFEKISTQRVTYCLMAKFCFIKQ